MLADTHRNACLGNSMAVPPLRWLGERIEMVCRITEARTPLFDAIEAGAGEVAG
jgi:hypothetical protein